MSLVECATAADVRANNRARKAWRKAMYAQPKSAEKPIAEPEPPPPPPLPTIIIRGAAIPHSAPVSENLSPIAPVISNSVRRVQRIVCAYFSISYNDLVNHRRNGAEVLRRHIGMYLAKTITGASYPEIARKFGKRDHTTVLHAVRKIEKLRTNNTEVNDILCELEAHLGA